MAVEYPKGSQVQQGLIVADRDLYLDKSGTKIVEAGDAGSASQLVAKGHAITSSEADRLGLSVKDGKVVQGDAENTESLRTSMSELEAERDAFAAKIEAYRKDNAVKDIPNTMEAQRVALEARIEATRLKLSQAIKSDAGKDPLKGESQATSTRPDLDTATPDKPAAKPADGAKTKTAAPPAT